MSRDTHLCNRCRAIFDVGPDLPTALGPERSITVSSPDGPSGRQWSDLDTRNSWTEVCGMFLRRGWKDDHVDKVALMQSAAEGCYICTSIWRRYSKFTNEGSSYRPRVKGIEYEIRSDHGKTFSLVITVRGAMESCVGLLCGVPSTRFHFYGVLHSDLESEYVQTSLASTTRSLQSMQQGRAWIDECEQNHVMCQDARQKFSLPRRLIRASYVEGTNELSASLCEGSTLPPDTQYLTLSHRWNEQNSLRLTKGNVSRLKHGIPLHELSPLFRDALFTTLQLGLEYLWIDCLCIVQDDLEDWQRESEAMCQIYKGALCNIAASSLETNEGQGFLPPQRRRHPIVPPLVHVNWHASPIPPHNRIRGRDFIISEVLILHGLQRDELYGRAWLLQEQLLPLRILHFQGDQIYWECRTSICNEVWPRGWSKAMGRKYDSQIERFRISSEDTQLAEKTLAYIIWLEMVSHYSQRAITVDTDRLPALAGIAADTAVLLEDTYVSGIWQGSLHNGVLYKHAARLPSLDAPPVKQPLWGKVPSWSWAFLNKQITFSSTLHPPDTVNLCEMEVISDAKASMLKMQGSLMRMDRVVSSDDAVECQTFWKPAWDDPIFTRSGRKGSAWTIHTQEDHWFAQRCAASGKPYIEALFSELLFIPVIFEEKGMPVYIRSFDQIRPWSRIIGLLLLRAQGEKGRGLFHRVGTAEFRRSAGGSESTLELFNSGTRTYQETLREDDFQWTDGKGVYSILVI